MRNILITGITGKSGRYLLERIKEDKYNRYILLVHNDIPDIKRDNIEIIKGDILDAESLQKVFKEHVDMLFNIAGIYFSEALTDAALRSGVKDIFLVHTTGIYSKYKKAGEEYREIERNIFKKTEGKGVRITIIRPTMIYGDLKDRNISSFIRMVDKLRIFPLVGKGDSYLQPVWAGDLGNAYFDIIKNNERLKHDEYILSGKEPLTLRELLETLGRKLEVKNTFVSVPFPLAYMGAWMLFVLSLGRFDMREKVQRLVEDRAFDHLEAMEDFGYMPLSFEDGIEDEIRMYLEARK